MHKNAIHRQHFASSNIQFLNNNNNIFSNSNNNNDRNHHNYQSNRNFHKPKKMNKRAVVYLDKLRLGGRGFAFSACLPASFKMHCSAHRCTLNRESAFCAVYAKCGEHEFF